MWNCRFFCLSVGVEKCAAVVKVTRSAPHLFSKCDSQPTKPKTKYASALKGSVTSLCMNINVPCPEEGCGTFPTTYGLIPHYTSAHPGLQVTAVLGELGKLVFQKEEDLSVDEVQQEKDLLGRVTQGVLRHELDKIVTFRRAVVRKLRESHVHHHSHSAP